MFKRPLKWTNQNSRFFFTRAVVAILLYQVRFVNSFHNSCYNLGSRSEVLRLGVGPNHLIAVDAISKHLRDKCPEVFGVAAGAGDNSSEPGSALRNAVKFFSSPIESDAKSDQHYIDDLRAGAFQYVEAENDDHTKPYQVIINQLFSIISKITETFSLIFLMLQIWKV